MKISIVANLFDVPPSVMKHLETSDLIFKVLGVHSRVVMDARGLPTHLAHKCIVLNHSAFSDRVLNYIITPTPDQCTQLTIILPKEEAVELETIRESLPRDVPMDIYDIRGLYSDSPLEVTICST